MRSTRFLLRLSTRVSRTWRRDHPHARLLPHRASGGDHSAALSRLSSPFPPERLAACTRPCVPRKSPQTGHGPLHHNTQASKHPSTLASNTEGLQPPRSLQSLKVNSQNVLSPIPSFVSENHLHALSIGRYGSSLREECPAADCARGRHGKTHDDLGTITRTCCSHEARLTEQWTNRVQKQTRTHTAN